MSYNEPIDEKYTILVNDGNVKITRYGDEWLENPQGSKAWISVADQLETIRKEREYEPEGELAGKDLEDATKQITEHLAAVWGWLPDESEAIQLGEQLASVLHFATANSETEPLTLLKAILAPRP